MRRRRLDLVLTAAGTAVLVVSAALARRGVYQWEVDVFHAINGLPGSFRSLLWVLNQYGTAITIPVTSAIALAFRKWILALSLLISGAGVYLLAKVLKGIVDRGRPAAVLTEVIEREGFSPNSLGYPSGHAAVAWAITIILLAYVGRPWQIAAIVVAIFVPLVRMYVAAHLPLDLIGGAALGVTVASAVNLVFGVPVRTRAEEIRAGPAQRDTSTGRATGQRGSRAEALFSSGSRHPRSKVSDLTCPDPRLIRRIGLSGVAFDR
jgi:membrane-associated phospholipid phosphatase